MRVENYSEYQELGFQPTGEIKHNQFSIDIEEHQNIEGMSHYRDCYAMIQI